MNIPDLRKALNEGIVLFQFIKKDGTTRHARGTTCPDLVPTDDAPKGKRTPRTTRGLRSHHSRLLRHRPHRLALHAYRHHLVLYPCPQTLVKEKVAKRKPCGWEYYP